MTENALKSKISLGVTEQGSEMTEMLDQATWRDSVDISKGRVCEFSASWSGPSRRPPSQDLMSQCFGLEWESYWSLVQTGSEGGDLLLTTWLQPFSDYLDIYSIPTREDVSYKTRQEGALLVPRPGDTQSSAISFSIYDRLSCIPGWRGTHRAAVDDLELSFLWFLKSNPEFHTCPARNLPTEFDPPVFPIPRLPVCVYPLLTECSLLLLIRLLLWQASLLLTRFRDLLEQLNTIMKEDFFFL